VRFEDTGAGVHPDDLLKVFEPFSSGQCEENSRLGLSVSYGIVKQHGGVIDVENQPGAGAAFTVRLPMVATGRA